MESIVSKEKAEKALSEAPVWAKMLYEQMSSANKEVLDMRKELQLLKTEMNQRVGQVENDVKLQEFQCQTMSLEVTSLKKELSEINDTRNDLKQVEQAKDCIDDLEQYNRRNCLTFTGIKAGEDETENADEVIVDICQNKLQIELHRFTLDRTHRLGRKRLPRSDSEVSKPRPIIAKSNNYHDIDSGYKCKQKLRNQG